MKNKDVVNKNDKGGLYGYQERYNNSILYFRGIYKNDLEVGYDEWHSSKETEFYIR